ncbi:hypothetical protein AB0M11_05395 [Streptomyces sp. NPDC051987]|uniref:hypothetical protein n=1 Tax=Streptomyces sp. NPDC051987 TaxID=3155808 RepID=UPI003442EECC
MRAIRVASAALLGLGALALCAPVILASDSGGGLEGGRRPLGFRVTPATVAAGGRVSLHLDRGGGCRGAATVTSGVFGTVRIPSERDSETATVDRTAKSRASYRVTVTCDGSSASAELAVAGSVPAAPADAHGLTDGHADAHGLTDGRTGGRGDARPDPAGQTGGRADAHAGGHTAEHPVGSTAGAADEHGNGSGAEQADGHTDGRSDEQAGGHTDGETDSRADGGAGGRTDGGSAGGSVGGQGLNPQPLPPGHGVQAGQGGGSLGGFDLQEIGLGAALVVGSVGTAYRRSRRHAGEDGA